MKYFYILCLAVATLCSCGGNNENEAPLSLRLANAELSQEKNVQVVNLTSKEHKLFIEDGPIYVDIPLHHFDVSTIDSVIYTIAGTNFTFYDIHPPVIDYFTKLDGSLTVSLFRNGEVLAIPGTKKNRTNLSVFRTHPLIENDAIVFGILVLILAMIFWTHSLKTPFWKKFYTYVPALLLCYFVPAICNSFNIINGEFSELYTVSKDFFLPASLVLLCLSIDLKGIMNLGPKALIMFFTATIGIVIGGPLALAIVDTWAQLPGGEDPQAAWRGLSTVAGSWIGGGANQTAMKEIANCPETQFSGMIVVDVFVANIWMAFLLFGAGITVIIDKKLKSDTSAIDKLKDKIEKFQQGIARIPSFTDLLIIGGIAFVGVGLAHLFSSWIAPSLDGVISTAAKNPDSIAKYLTSLGSGFFWLIILATAIGVLLSFTKLKNMEGAGASKFGSVFIYLLVATIGMKMDIPWLIENWSKFVNILLIGLIWMAIHVIILLIVAKIIKAPFFYVAVGSQANVGGAASAPIVASAFSPALAPVGVLLAVLGYAIGTIGAIICMEMMHFVSQ
jgi:uncharacterized membrane protein